MLRTQNVKCRRQTGSKGHVSGWISATNRVQGNACFTKWETCIVYLIDHAVLRYFVGLSIILKLLCDFFSFYSTIFIWQLFQSSVSIYLFILFFSKFLFNSLGKKCSIVENIWGDNFLRYIIQVARFGEEEKYNGYLIREMKLILCSRDGICEKLYSLPTSGHDDIGRVGKWWARDWYDIKGYWSFSEYCRSNVLESCNDSMNSLHYDIPSSMLPRIIERWVNVVIYIYTYN